MNSIHFSKLYAYLYNYKKKLFHLKRKFLRHERIWNILFLLSFLLILLVILIVWFELNSVKFTKHRSKNGFDEMDEKIDWHDWKLIEEDRLRIGIGEHGDGEFLWYYPPSTQQINDTHGYNGYLSDKIALNRSLKDLRPKEYVSVGCFIISPSTSFSLYLSLSMKPIKCAPNVCICSPF